MLEGAVYHLLAGYLGHYFHNLQREQLRVGLWSGVVLLDSVELRLEAFDYLQLPFSIKAGSVGKLRLQIPWKMLGWEPIVISLEDIVLCAGPREDWEWDEEPANRRALAAKRATLAAAEIVKLSRRVSEDKSGESFLSYLSTKVIDNVQVEVKNVHIQYVDSATDPERAFAFGATLEQLKVTTAGGKAGEGTAQGATVGVSPGAAAAASKRARSGLVHKLVTLRQFGFYWNSCDGSRDSVKLTWDNGVRAPWERKSGQQSPNFVLRPVNAELKLTVSKGSVQEKGYPQHSVVVTVEDVAAALEEHQYRDMLLLMDAISVYQLRERYGKYRVPRSEGYLRGGGGIGVHQGRFEPDKSGLEGGAGEVDLLLWGLEEEGDGPNRKERERERWGKLMWQYAIRAVVADVREKLYRRSWNYLGWRLKRRRRYVELYEMKLKCVQQGLATSTQQFAELESMEEALSIADILQFRAAAEARLLVQEAIASPPRGGGEGAEGEGGRRGWLNWLSMGRLGAGGSPMEAGDFTGAISEEDLKELYAATDFRPSVEPDGPLPQTKCLASVSCHVAEAVGTLRSSYSKRDIVRVILRNIAANVRNWGDSTNVTMTLGTLEALDLCTPNTLFPLMVSPKRSTNLSLAGGRTSVRGRKAMGRSASVLDLASNGNATPGALGARGFLEGLGHTATPLLRIEFEIKPRDTDADVAISVHMQPLEIVYCPEFLKRAETFFSHPSTVLTHHELVVAALNGLETLRARTLSKAEYVFATRKMTTLRADIRAPLLLVPESHTSQNGMLLAVDLGSVHFSSGPVPEWRARFMEDAAAGEGLWQKREREREGEGVGEGKGGLDLVEKAALYDRFNLRMADLQVVVARQSSPWRLSLEEEAADSALHLVQRFNLSIAMDFCALAGDPSLTKLKVLGNLPSLRLHLSSAKCQALKSVLSTLTGPPASDTSPLPPPLSASSSFSSSSSSSSSSSTPMFHPNIPSSHQSETFQKPVQSAPAMGSTPSRSEVLEALYARSASVARMKGASGSGSGSVERTMGNLENSIGRRTNAADNIRTGEDGVTKGLSRDKSFKYEGDMKGIGNQKARDLTEKAALIDVNMQLELLVAEICLEEKMKTGVQAGKSDHILSMVWENLEFRFVQRAFEEEIEAKLWSLTLIDGSQSSDSPYRSMLATAPRRMPFPDTELRHGTSPALERSLPERDKREGTAQFPGISEKNSRNSRDFKQARAGEPMFIFKFRAESPEEKHSSRGVLNLALSMEDIEANFYRPTIGRLLSFFSALSSPSPAPPLPLPPHSPSPSSLYRPSTILNNGSFQVPAFQNQLPFPDLSTTETITLGKKREGDSVRKGNTEWDMVLRPTDNHWAKKVPLENKSVGKFQHPRSRSFDYASIPVAQPMISSSSSTIGNNAGENNRLNHLDERRKGKERRLGASKAVEHAESAEYREGDREGERSSKETESEKTLLKHEVKLTRISLNFYHSQGKVGTLYLNNMDANFLVSGLGGEKEPSWQCKGGLYGLRLGAPQGVNSSIVGDLIGGIGETHPCSVQFRIGTCAEEKVSPKQSTASDSPQTGVEATVEVKTGQVILLGEYVTSFVDYFGSCEWGFGANSAPQTPPSKERFSLRLSFIDSVLLVPNQGASETPTAYVQMDIPQVSISLPSLEPAGEEEEEERERERKMAFFRRQWADQKGREVREVEEDQEREMVEIKGRGVRVAVRGGKPFSADRIGVIGVSRGGGEWELPVIEQLEGCIAVQLPLEDGREASFEKSVVKVYVKFSTLNLRLLGGGPVGEVDVLRAAFEHNISNLRFLPETTSDQNQELRDETQKEAQNPVMLLCKVENVRVGVGVRGEREERGRRRSGKLSERPSKSSLSGSVALLKVKDLTADMKIEGEENVNAEISFKEFSVSHIIRPTNGRFYDSFGSRNSLESRSDESEESISVEQTLKAGSVWLTQPLLKMGGGDTSQAERMNPHVQIVWQNREIICTDVHVNLPNSLVHVHIGAWNKVISAVNSVLPQHASPDVRVESGKREGMSSVQRQRERESGREAVEGGREWEVGQLTHIESWGGMGGSDSLRTSGDEATGRVISRKLSMEKELLFEEYGSLGGPSEKNLRFLRKEGEVSGGSKEKERDAGKRQVINMAISSMGTEFRMSSYGECRGENEWEGEWEEEVFLDAGEWREGNSGSDGEVMEEEGSWDEVGEEEGESEEEEEAEGGSVSWEKARRLERKKVGTEKQRGIMYAEIAKVHTSVEREDVIFRRRKRASLRIYSDSHGTLREMMQEEETRGSSPPQKHLVCVMVLSLNSKLHGEIEGLLARWNGSNEFSHMEIHLEETLPRHGEAAKPLAGPPFRMPLLQVSTLKLTLTLLQWETEPDGGGEREGEHSGRSKVCVSVEVKAGDIDSWISYRTLRFFKLFRVEPAGEGKESASPEVDLELKMKGVVERAALLLSDGRLHCNAPIAECLFSSIQAEACVTPPTSTASLGCQFRVNYHNIEKVTWEPVVEPWAVNMSVKRKEREDGLPPALTQIEVASTAPLNINVTEAMVLAVARAKEVWEESQTEESVSAETVDGADSALNSSTSTTQAVGEGPNGWRYAPYWLHNATGVAVKYWLTVGLAELATSEESSENLGGPFAWGMQPMGSNGPSEIIHAGDSVPLYVEEGPEAVLCRRNDGVGGSRGESKLTVQHRMMRIQLDGMVVPSPPFSIDLVGTRAYMADLSGASGLAIEEEEEEEEREGEREEESEVGKGRGRGRGREEGEKEFEGVVGGRQLWDDRSMFVGEGEGETGGRMTGFKTPVVCEVVMERYSKRVTLRSTVAVVNATGVPLEVRFDIPFALFPKVMPPVPPGRSLPLPVHLAETGCMRWRPQGGAHMWSEPQPLPGLLSGSEERMCPHRAVVCAPTQPLHAPFRYCFSVEERGRDSTVMETKGRSFPRNENWRQEMGTGSPRVRARGGGEGWINAAIQEITIRPPLVIENLLPHRTHCWLQTAKGGIIRHSRIPEGGWMDVHQVDPTHDVLLSFAPIGCIRTAPVIVSSAAALLSVAEGGSVRQAGEERKPPVKIVKLEQEDTEGVPVLAELETVVRLSCGARRLSLSCPFWLYNTTELKLAVQDAEAGSHMQHFVPPAVSNSPPTNNGWRMGDMLSEKQGGEGRRGLFSLDSTGLQIVLSHEGEGEGRGGEVARRERAVGQSFRWKGGQGTFGRRGKGVRRDASTESLPSPLLEESISAIKAGQEVKHGGRQGRGKQLSTTPSDQILHTGGKQRTLPLSLSSPTLAMAAGGGGKSPTNADSGGPVLLGAHSDSLFPHGVMYSPAADYSAEGAEPKLRVRVVGGGVGGGAVTAWSEPFPCDPPGGVAVVTIPLEGSQGAYILAASAARAGGNCETRTRTLTFRPRYVLANAVKADICFRQQGTDRFFRLPAGQQQPLHLTDRRRNLLISIRLAEHGWDWSGAFAPPHVGATQLKLRCHHSGAVRTVRIDVSTPQAGTCLVLVSEDDTGFMPYRIHNFSKEVIRIHQLRCETTETTLRSYNACDYAWDEPCLPHRLVVEVPGAAGAIGTYRLDEVKEYPIVLLPATAQRPERRLQVSVRAEGPRRVMSIMDMEMHPSGEGLAGGGAPSKRGDTISRLEAPRDTTEKISIRVAMIGISFIDSTPQELLYVSIGGLHFQAAQGQLQQIAELHVASIQIDNQLRNAVYPVLLAPSFPPSMLNIPVPSQTTEFGRMDAQNGVKEEEGEDERAPTAGGVVERESLGGGENVVVAGVSRWRELVGGVECFHCLMLRLAPMRLELEERLLLRLLQFVERLSAAMERGSMLRSATDSVWLHGSNVGQNSSMQGTYASVPSHSTLHGTLDRRTEDGELNENGPKMRAIEFGRGEEESRRGGGRAGDGSFVLEEEGEGLGFAFQGSGQWSSEGRRLCWPLPVAVMAVGEERLDMWALAKGTQKVYIEMVEIARIEVTVSFVSAPWLPEESRGAAARGLFGAMGIVLQRRMIALANAEGVALRLGALRHSHHLGSLQALRTRVVRHYGRQLLHLLYKVLGSADFLGNPMGFLASLARGMWDFVSTPALRLTQRPQEVVQGVAQGTASLLQNTLFAFSNAATRMSGAAAKGVAALALDQEYFAELERRQREMGAVETGVLEALLQGLTGVLEYPVRGLAEGGIPGLLSGAAVGLLGAIAKPTASVLELAGRTALSIRNSTRPYTWQPTRGRPPRHLSLDLPLQPYSWERAVGQAVILEADGGRLRHDVYVACVPLKERGRFGLLTSRRLLVARSSSLSGPAGGGGPEWAVEWEAALPDVLRIEREGPILTVLELPTSSRIIDISKSGYAKPTFPHSPSPPLRHGVLEFATEGLAMALHGAAAQAMTGHDLRQRGLQRVSALALLDSARSLLPPPPPPPLEPSHGVGLRV